MSCDVADNAMEQLKVTQNNPHLILGIVTPRELLPCPKEDVADPLAKHLLFVPMQ